jgi:hypothetical protein
MRDSEHTLSFLLSEPSLRPRSSHGKSQNDDSLFLRRGQPKSTSTSKMRRKNSASIEKSKSKSSIQSRSVPDNKLSLDVAALVVKQYLLPMFEAENISPNLKPKDSLLGIAGVTDALHKPFEVISGTVYGELKEVEIIYRELLEAREELKAVTQKFKDAEQQKESYQAELDNLKKLKLGMTAEIKLLQQDFLDNHRKFQLAELKISYLGGLCVEYRKLLNQSEAEKKQFGSDLHEEKALNDKRRNVAAELEHGNELLKMENEIMSEKLRGLYAELDKIASRRILEDKLSIEFEELARSLRVQAKKVDDLTIHQLRTINERKDYQADSDEINTFTEEIRSIRDRLFNSSKDAMTRLLKAISEVTTQREEYRIQLNKLEKDYKDTVNEMAKIRKRIKQYKQTKGEGEEKVCKRCNKVYNENENYNWSCRRHAGEFSASEQIWWCCGKQGSNALGCQIAKHESKEDEEDTLEKDKDLNEKLKQMNTVCSSCKEVGHKPHDCPKDPNIRGKSDPYDEVVRIENIRNKKRANADNIEISQKSMAFLSNRLGDQAFGLDLVSSFESGDFGESDEELQRRIAPFNDIVDVRGQISFRSEENLIRIPTLRTKELEKEIEGTKQKKKNPVMSSISGRDSSNQGISSRRFIEDQSEILKESPGNIEFPMTPKKNGKESIEFSIGSSSESEDHKIK